MTVAPRAPAVPIAVAVSLGIVCDHQASLPLVVWLSVAAGALLLWGYCYRTGISQFALLWLSLACLAVGAGWHHTCWSVLPANHIAAFATTSPRLVLLRARVVDHPEIVAKPEVVTSAIPQYDRTLCTLQCQSIVEQGVEIPVYGRARLDVRGHLLHIERGDLVELTGMFSRPVGAANPGNFDYRDYLRTAGQHVVVHCGLPDNVHLLRTELSGPGGLQLRLRQICQELLEQHLGEQTAPVGIALLLGMRTTLPDDLRLAFAESGTMHVLAISGANVAILASLIWLICRLAGLPRRIAAMVVLGGILFYAFVAVAQPPVLRAVLMIAIMLAGTPWQRTTSSTNLLAFAVLGVLAWNPLHLFDIGAQLSFLAVAALIWFPAWWARQVANRDSLDQLEVICTRWQWWRQQIRYWLTMAVGTTLAVWLFTLPLALATFHLFAPIGFVMTLLLSPLVVVVLWSGYALLMVGLILPPLAAPLAWLFDLGLQCLIAGVTFGAAVPGGHVYLPGPGVGWLIGFYVLLALLLLGGRFERIALRGMLLWTVIGLVQPLLPRPAELRCTFLSVGHGAAVLLECPNGRTILYDAGQLDNGQRAQRTIQNALWKYGRASIDTLVVSHADVDHFNAIAGLSQTVSLGEVCFHRSFLDFQQSSVEQLCERLSQQGVPQRLLWEGDRLAADPEVRLQVLHPPVAAGSTSASDNAQSVVLLIEYAGRRILLTGDLENEGLTRLLDMPPQPVDVLLSPHHGSAKANPAGLADWAQPKWVVISGGRRDRSERLREVYGTGCEVVSTFDEGAITFTVSRSGSFAYSANRPQR